MNTRKGDFAWAFVLVVISTILLMPATNKIYSELNLAHPYLMGFIKFMILATMGELLAIRIISEKWMKLKGFFEKAIAWGCIGVAIVFMFKLFPMGIAELIEKGLLYGTTGFGQTLLMGIYTSIVVNYAFGPIFMSVHRISDTYIDMKVDGLNPTIGKAIDAIDWPNFIKYVVGKTIPFFWLPAHTITFILPEDYRILFAAFLSIALGIILAYAKKKTAGDVRATV